MPKPVNGRFCASSVTGWIHNGAVYGGKYIITFGPSFNHPAGMVICSPATRLEDEDGEEFDGRTITRFGIRFEDEGEFLEAMTCEE